MLPSGLPAPTLSSSASGGRRKSGGWGERRPCSYQSRPRRHKADGGLLIRLPAALPRRRPKTYSSMLTVSPPSRVTKAAKTFVEIVAGKKMTEPSPRRPWTPLPWNE